MLQQLSKRLLLGLSFTFLIATTGYSAPQAGVTKEALSEFIERNKGASVGNTEPPIPPETPTGTEQIEKQDTDSDGDSQQVDTEVSKEPGSERIKQTPSESLVALLTFKSLSSEFHQQTYDESGSLIDQTNGRFWLEQPNKFRWEVEHPYQQVITSDGDKVTTFDPDLDQAIIQSIEQIIGTSPAKILGQPEAIEKLYKISLQPVSNAASKVAAFVLSPLEKDDGIDRIELFFLNQVIQRITFKDGLGQTTNVVLSDISVGEAIDLKTFQQELPKEVEI
jgi:outer membrane lipoprotein carrier protein